MADSCVLCSNHYANEISDTTRNRCQSSSCGKLLRCWKCIELNNTIRGGTTKTLGCIWINCCSRACVQDYKKSNPKEFPKKY